MSGHYSGGCACGAIRYEISGDPVFQNHCQCIDCRRRSGTGHGSYLSFANRGAVKIDGKASEWRVTADSGNDKIHAFCPVCGAPVYLTFTAMPDVIAVHAASLDDPSGFAPQALTYAGRGFAWDTVDPSIPAFERMPG